MLLAASLLLQTAGAISLGSYVIRDGLELSDTAALYQSAFSNVSVPGGRQSETLLEYRPDSGLRPIVAYGSTLYGRSDVNYVANYLAGRGLTVIAGVNGGFFTMSNGVPMGCVVTEGIIRSGGNGNTLGFREDGSALIGVPELSIRLTWPDGSIDVLNCNKALTKSNGLVLYSRDFDDNNHSAAKAVNVVLTADRDRLPLSGSVSAKVRSVETSDKPCEIPAGGLVLSMLEDTSYPGALSRLQALREGDALRITSSVSSAWADVTCALGGDEMLVQNGTACKDFKLDSANNRAARTAAGLKQDGTLVLYTVDGAQSGHSAGLTLKELAERMAEQGCVTALNLDGGGSTTLSARKPGESGLTTFNRPSDGSLRKCANYIFLARETVSAGEAKRLHLYPYNAAVLSGGRLQLTVKATDAAWNPALKPDGITYGAQGGTVSADGIFTAGAGETATVTASSAQGASGKRTIRVVTDPGAIRVTDAQGQTVTSLRCAAGQVVELGAVSTWLGYTLVSQDDCYHWGVSGGAGEIDQNGTFTAAAGNATGAITCSAGKTSVSIPVQVTAQTSEGGVICGFEPGDSASPGTGVTLGSERNAAHVRYGKASFKVTYDLKKVEPAVGGARQVRTAMSVRLPDGADTVGLWIYGDNSGNSLSLLFGEGTGFKWLTRMNFSGWRYVTASLPEGVQTMTGFSITEYEGSPTSGTVWLDQLIASRGVLEDTVPPVISAAVNDGALDISVSDAASGADTVTVSLDGATQNVAFSGGKAHLALPTDGAAHQARIEAADRCGNLAARTVELPGKLENSFSDMEGHWSLEFVNYCAREGILQGSSDGHGAFRFRPDASMSRQEFAAALVRFLGTDTSAYAARELPFADAGDVSPWALDAMRAAYSMGLLTGSTSNGVRRGLPKAPITRQEAVTILSRTQARGYRPASLSGFSDQGQVSSWAVEHMASMVGQGILSGSGGKLTPNAPLTRGQVAKILYFLY